MSIFSYGFGKQNTANHFDDPMRRGNERHELEPNVYFDGLGEKHIQPGALRLSDGSLHPAYKGQPGSLVDNILKKKKAGGQINSDEQNILDKYYASDPTRGLASVGDLYKKGRGVRLLPGSPGNSSNKLIVDMLKGLSESRANTPVYNPPQPTVSPSPVTAPTNTSVRTWTGAVPSSNVEVPAGNRNVTTDISALLGGYPKKTNDFLALLGMSGKLNNVDDIIAWLRATGNGGSYLGNLLSKYRDERTGIEDEDAVNVAKRVAKMQEESNKSMPSLTDMLQANVDAVNAMQNNNTLADQYRNTLAVAQEATRNRARNLSAGINPPSVRVASYPSLNVTPSVPQQPAVQPSQPSQGEIVANVDDQRAMAAFYDGIDDMRRRMAGDDFMA